MKSILVVDDEKNIRFLFKEELEEDGYQVTIAGSGEEALVKMEEKLFDLAILDIRMPDMSGLELLEKIRQTNKKIPVIMVTAVRGLKDDFTIWQSKVSAFITKPVDLDDLKEKVRTVLAGNE